MVAIVASQALNTPSHGPTDWRYWYLSALTPAVGAASYRLRGGLALSAAVLAIGIVVTVEAVRGGPAFACLSGPVPVLLSTGFAGHYVRRTLDRSLRHVAASREADLRLRRDIAEQEEHDRENRARVAALAASVRPALDTVVAGGALPPAQRRRLTVLEASLRDHLSALSLLTADVVDALYTARSRGARVELAMLHHDDNDENRDQTRHLIDQVIEADAPYRTLLTQTLRLVGSGAYVRAVWRPANPAAASTVIVVADDLDDTGETLRGSVAELGAAAVTSVEVDDDSLMLEVSPAPRVATVRAAKSCAECRPDCW